MKKIRIIAEIHWKGRPVFNQDHEPVTPRFADYLDSLIVSITERWPIFQEKNVSQEEIVKILKDQYGELALELRVPSFKDGHDVLLEALTDDKVEHVNIIDIYEIEC